jgi:hypothetical protein
MNGDCIPVRVRPWLGGYLADFKLIWKADWIRVQHWHQGKRIDQIFPTADAAKAAAWELKYQLEAPHINGFASKIGAAKAQAEAVFKPQHA